MSSAGIGRLLVSCMDRPGIVAAISRFLAERGANIVESDQHSTDPEVGSFFMRTEFKLDGLEDRADEIETAFGEEVAEPFGMDWQMRYASRRKRVAILVSRYDHCLAELLWRWRRGELYADIPLVASNHAEMASEAARFLRAHRAWLKRLITRSFSPEPLMRGLQPLFDDPAAGLAGLHVFTFNELERTERWRREAVERFSAAAA